MWPITASAPAVRPVAVDHHETHAARAAEASAGTDTELNSVALKKLRAAEQIIPVLESSARAGKLDQIRAILSKHGFDTGKEDWDQSKLKASMSQLSYVNEKLTPDDDIASSVAKQHKRVAETADVISTMKGEIQKARTQANLSVMEFKVEQQKALQKQAATEAAEEKEKGGKFTVNTSYSELWAAMAKAIGNIKSDYVDFYADLMQKYTELYEAYNNTVQKASANAVKAGEDGNNVDFNNSTMQQGYTDFNNAVKGIDPGSVENWGSMSQEEKDSMTATLEPAFKIDQSTGKISFNLDQYHNSPNFPSDGSGKVSTASYQAWLATFNAVGTGLQSNMQSFAQRYTQANSTFDNLNKVLSGAISSLADSAKEVFRNLV